MWKLAIKYGLWMFAGYAIFFLVMHLLGFSDKYVLRIMNAPIQFLLIYLTLGEYYEHELEEHKNQINGFKLGVMACFVGVLLFTIMQFVFMTNNSEFFEGLNSSINVINISSPLVASVLLFVEGMLFGTVVVYFSNKYIRGHLKEVFK